VNVMTDERLREACQLWLTMWPQDKRDSCNENSATVGFLSRMTDSEIGNLVQSGIGKGQIAAMFRELLGRG